MGEQFPGVVADVGLEGDLFPGVGRLTRPTMGHDSSDTTRGSMTRAARPTVGRGCPAGLARPQAGVRQNAQLWGRATDSINWRLGVVVEGRGGYVQRLGGERVRS